jgi:hypothetical protein
MCVCVCVCVCVYVCVCVCVSSVFLLVPMVEESCCAVIRSVGIILIATADQQTRVS